MSSQMRRTAYGYVCVTEEQIERKLDQEIKERRAKEHGAFSLHKKEKNHEKRKPSSSN